LVGLISFLTGGKIEARAWTIQKGTLAPQAAGTIHTDFEKHFIKAEVVQFATFVELGGWVKAREAGKVTLGGKDYEMKDGDVVDFKVSA
jgi:ribosome-binding ATPase YchF (GTP1/OBG family)